MEKRVFDSEEEEEEDLLLSLLLPFFEIMEEYWQRSLLKFIFSS